MLHLHDWLEISLFVCKTSSFRDVGNCNRETLISSGEYLLKQPCHYPSATVLYFYVAPNLKKRWLKIARWNWDTQAGERIVGERLSYRARETESPFCVQESPRYCLCKYSASESWGYQCYTVFGHTLITLLSQCPYTHIQQEAGSGPGEAAQKAVGTRRKQSCCPLQGRPAAQPTGSDLHLFYRSLYVSQTKYGRPHIWYQENYSWLAMETSPQQGSSVMGLADWVSTISVGLLYFSPCWFY